MEFGEQFEEGARRELLEECGVVPTQIYMGPLLNVVDTAHGYHALVQYMVAQVDETTEPRTLEPHLCAGWEWHAWSNLPTPLYSTLQQLRTTMPFYSPFI